MAAAFVAQAIAQNKVVVFSKTFCPFCTKAKSALASVNAPGVVVVELDKRSDGDAIQAALAALAGKPRVTVPQVFVAGKCIGGGDDTAALARSGKLAQMLAA